MNTNPKVKHKHPTKRQEALLKNLAMGMSQTDAAIAAGYSKKFAGQSGHQALRQIAKKPGRSGSTKSAERPKP